MRRKVSNPRVLATRTELAPLACGSINLDLAPHVGLPLCRRLAFGTHEGGGRNATGLARQSQSLMQSPTGELSPMAFPGGGCLSRARAITPTRCVQRLGLAVACAERSA